MTIAEIIAFSVAFLFAPLICGPLLVIFAPLSLACFLSGHIEKGQTFGAIALVNLVILAVWITLYKLLIHPVQGCRGGKDDTPFYNDSFDKQRDMLYKRLNNNVLMRGEPQRRRNTLEAIARIDEEERRQSK